MATLQSTTISGTLDGMTNFAGMIAPFGVNTAPTGWIRCNGSAIASSTYNGLYDVIGTAWGGNASNFNVPDLRGRFVRDFDDSAGRDPGRNFASFQDKGVEYHSKNDGLFNNPHNGGSMVSPANRALMQIIHPGYPVGHGTQSHKSCLFYAGWFHANTGVGHHNFTQHAGNADETRPMNVTTSYMIKD